MNSTPLTLAVFDMAGTTVTDPGIVSKCFQEAADATGLQMSEDDILAVQGVKKREVFKRYWTRQLGDGAAGVEAEAQRSFDTFREILEAYYAEHPVAPTEGCLDCLAALRERGVRIALTTGFYRRVTDLLLDQLGWLDALDETYRGPDDHVIQLSLCSDDVEHGRPAPDLIYLAMERLGVADAAQVLKVGDTPIDLQAAEAAGCRFAFAVTNGTHAREALEPHPHAALLPSLGALVPWLDGHEALLSRSTTTTQPLSTSPQR